MTADQKVVAIGAASGILAMTLSVWVLTKALPAPTIADLAAERLAYALQANAVAVLAFFIMLAAIGNSRFLSEAIDPTRRAETPAQVVDGRVADNTLQQNFVFTVASLALSTVVPLQHLQVVWACTLVFIAARSAFWVGYRLKPIYRAPGMAATSYMNLGMLLYVIYRIV